ncbi:MAG: serine/threonine protein kinase [Sandaracinus sp.]|nr:serine/threonine protein kinase [Sandaracinus sp.]
MDGPTLLASRYELREPLGRGGMGTVHAAYDQRLARMVAVKRIRPELLAEPDVLTRFEREARAAAQLTHPNVVQVLDFGTDEGAPFVVMEHLVGETLDDRIVRGPMPLEEAVAIHQQLLEALSVAHHAGIVHRDVKPANVFLARMGGREVVKLVDFGLATLLEEAGPSKRLTKTGMLVGSLAYLPPERLTGARADEHTDLWAVAACLFESLTGERAFSASSLPAMHARIANGLSLPIETLRPDAPLGLVEVVRRGLRPTVAERFPNADAMAEALAHWRDTPKSERSTVAIRAGATPAPQPMPPPGPAPVVAASTASSRGSSSNVSLSALPVNLDPVKLGRRLAVAGLAMVLGAVVIFATALRPSEPEEPPVAAPAPTTTPSTPTTTPSTTTPSTTTPSTPTTTPSTTTPSTTTPSTFESPEPPPSEPAVVVETPSGVDVPEPPPTERPRPRRVVASPTSTAMTSMEPIAEPAAMQEPTTMHLRLEGLLEPEW